MAGGRGLRRARRLVGGVSTTRFSHPSNSPPSSAAGSRGCTLVLHEIFSKLPYLTLFRTYQVRVRICGLVRFCRYPLFSGSAQERGSDAIGEATPLSGSRPCRSSRC